MIPLPDAASQVDGFAESAHADKVRFFAWWLHAHAMKPAFKVADIGGCYDALHMHRPGNLDRAVRALEDQGDLLKSSSGFRLEKSVRDRYEARYGQRSITVQVHELLAALPAKLSSKAQKEYLDEALVCFRHGAWRAAVIMTWNLAFDHLCEFITARRLADFNASFQSSKKRLAQIAQRSDLRELKESEIVTVCRASGITDKTQHKCLETHLGIRNDAAHPSGASFSQPKAEAFILDVVQTIVLGIG